MNGLVKIGLIAAAGALLFKDQIADLLNSPGAVAVPPTPQPPTQTPAPTPPVAVLPPAPTPPVAVLPPAPPPPAANSAVNFSQWIANTLGPGRLMMGADAWNYYYAQWSGKPQNADLFTPGNRGEQISLTDYLNRREAAGLSNVGRARLGRFDPTKAWS